MRISESKGLSLNGTFLPASALLSAAENATDSFKKEVLLFASQFLDSSETIVVQTSGSTGNPKTIHFKKEHLLNSALSTLNFFRLRANDSALLCLPMQYVAGKLMVVRALVGELQLTLATPSADISEALKEQYFKFAPFTPMQIASLVKNNLNYLLNKIEIILLGGGPVPDWLQREIQLTEAHVFHSYGMAESLTHVAIRKLNGSDSNAWYEALDEVQLSVDSRGCLAISRPDIEVLNLQTNDLVQLNGNRFQWLGRYDNLVNSGGVKLLPEQLENKIRPLMKNLEYFLAGIPDDVLGEKLVLFVEGETVIVSEITEHLTKYLNKNRFEIPREIIVAPIFPRTESGKIKRKELVHQFSISPEDFKRLSV